MRNDIFYLYYNYPCTCGSLNQVFGTVIGD